MPKPPKNKKTLAKEWAQKGFCCDLWVDPPGQWWENYVHEVPSTRSGVSVAPRPAGFMARRPYSSFKLILEIEDVLSSNPLVCECQLAWYRRMALECPEGLYGGI